MIFKLQQTYCLSLFLNKIEFRLNNKKLVRKGMTVKIQLINPLNKYDCIALITIAKGSTDSKLSNEDG